MDLFLILTFLFYCGAILGWCLEFLFRNLISHKGPRGKFFINPGFCKGPYLPIYGVGLSAMCLISYFVTEKIPNASPVIVILIIGAVMILIEFIGGFVLLQNNIRLWDYRDRPGNIMGIVCPLFSLIWIAIGAVYYLFIHPTIIDWIIWLADNLSYCFVVGFFWGVFIIDLVTSNKEAKMVKEFGENHEVIVKYEELKAAMQAARKENNQKTSFFNQLLNPPKTEAEKTEITQAIEQHTDVYESRETGVRSKRSGKHKRRSGKKKSKSN